MRSSAAFDEARKKAAAFIGIDRTKSSGRVRRNLLRKGVESRLADEVVRYFIEIDYIDDNRAAAAVATRYQGRKIRSRRAMMAVLVQNGIEPQAAGQYVLGMEKDRITARQLCHHAFPDASPDQETDMMKRLTRRGYSAGLAREVIRSYLTSGAD